jgi:hypothetical protein
LFGGSIRIACRVGDLKIVTDSVSSAGKFLIETRVWLVGVLRGMIEGTYSVAIEYPSFQQERVYGPLEQALSATNVGPAAAEVVEEAWRRTILPI